MTRYAYLGLFLVGLAAIVYVLMSAAGGKASKNPLDAYRTGQMEKMQLANGATMAPTESFYGPDGQPLMLADFEGKTLLVNFWATWCGPCEKEMPSIGALAGARSGEDFEVIAVSVDTLDDADYAKQRLAELSGNQLAFYHAPSNEQMKLAYAAGVTGFPTTVLYGPDGEEIARVAGELDWSALDAVNFVDAAIKQSR